MADEEPSEPNKQITNNQKTEVVYIQEKHTKNPFQT